MRSAEPLPAHAHCSARARACALLSRGSLVAGCCRVGAAARQYRDRDSPSCSRSTAAGRAFKRLGDGAGLGVERDFAGSPGRRGSWMPRGAEGQL